VLPRNHWKNVMQRGLPSTYLTLGTIAPGEHFGECRWVGVCGCVVVGGGPGAARCS
jgi:hypothetical protein